MVKKASRTSIVGLIASIVVLLTAVIGLIPKPVQTPLEPPKESGNPPPPSNSSVVPPPRTPLPPPPTDPSLLGDIYFCGADLDGEVIRVCNRLNSSVEISGWIIEDYPGKKPYQIPAGDVSPNGTWSVSRGDYNPTGYSQGLSLNKESDYLYLIDKAKRVVDAVCWGDNRDNRCSVCNEELAVRKNSVAQCRKVDQTASAWLDPRT